MELQPLAKYRDSLLPVALSPIVALGLLGACGTQHGVDGIDDEVSTGATEQTLDQALHEVRAWWGGMEVEQAAEVVVAHRLNGPYDECMKQRGFPSLDWRRSILLVGESSEMGATPWLIGPDIRPFSADLETNATNAKTESRLNNPPVRGEAEIRAEDECIEMVRSIQPSDDALDDLRLPSSVARLREEWSSSLLRAYEHLGTVQSFVACVDDQQVPELRGTSLDGASHVAADVERELEIGQGQLNSQKSDSFRAWEEPIAAAIWKCTEPTYGRAVAGLPDVVAKFEKDHAKEAAAAERHWTDVRAEAQDLGWSPTEPRAGYQED